VIRRSCSSTCNQRSGAAQQFVRGKNFDDYMGDLQLRSAVERQLEILGEARAD